MRKQWQSFAWHVLYCLVLHFKSCLHLLYNNICLVFYMLWFFKHHGELTFIKGSEWTDSCWWGCLCVIVVSEHLKYFYKRCKCCLINSYRLLWEGRIMFFGRIIHSSLRVKLKLLEALWGIWLGMTLSILNHFCRCHIENMRFLFPSYCMFLFSPGSENIKLFWHSCQRYLRLNVL